MKLPGKMAYAAAALALGAAMPAAAATKVTLLYTAATSFIGAYVAADQGFFTKQGLDVELRLTPNSSLMPAALLSNSAQIGANTATILFQANEAGLDMVAIAGTEVNPGRSESGIIARDDLGIKSAKDLAGKKIGVPGLGGVIDILAKKLIQVNGLNPKAVTYVELSLPQMASALRGKQVDAVALVDPFYTRTLQGGGAIEVGKFSTIIPDGTASTVFVSSRAWAKDNPKVVAAFRAALREAQAFIQVAANGPAVQKAMATYTKLPPEVAASLPLPPHLSVDISPDSLKFWVDVLREQGLLRGNPKPADAIAPVTAK
jgi:NitT/TauT family transport system substrate-binding protein